MFLRSLPAGLAFVLLMAACVPAAPPSMPHWVWTKAFALPKHTTSEGSGYFSIIEGQNGKLYIGTAKYGHNAYLVEFDPKSEHMEVVVDAHKEIKTQATGFAAQAKIHTRNNLGKSGKIYFGTKQGYPLEDEKREDYPGGYPMVYDPKSKTTRVYDIPVPHQGVISVMPDESRGIAYVSTSSDERPIDSTHFLVLDLNSGKYRDLLDCRHMYAFIVVDHLGRAYHPILGGEIARYSPDADKLEQLEQTIDGQPLAKDSLLAHPTGHPINWDISPDRKTLYSVAMSGNQLYRYDLTPEGAGLNGVSLGPLVPKAEKTDCRAMCVAPDGVVWAGVAATMPDKTQRLHVVSYHPGDKAPTDHGPLAISNPNYTEFNDADGKVMKWHHGVHEPSGEPMQPRYAVMGICAAKSGIVYVTTLSPFTVHALKIPRVAGVTTVYHHNSHSDVLLSRLMQTDTLNFTGDTPPLDLASLYVDQIPTNDLSEKLAKDYEIPIYQSIPESRGP
jgi:sugar lactone lactonase YvrE